MVEKKSGRQFQISDQTFLKSVDALDSKFRNKFLDKHRKLKAKIH